MRFMVGTLRRIAGWLWLATWAALLVLLLTIWAKLGGCVDERIRWWARLGLGVGPVIGCTVGAIARDLARWGGGRSHASLLRVFWVPPALAAAAVMLVTTVNEHPDAARGVLGLFCGYWAGFDVAMAAWPLACGRPYRFVREIPPEPAPETRECHESWWA